MGRKVVAPKEGKTMIQTELARLEQIKNNLELCKQAALGNAELAKVAKLRSLHQSFKGKADGLDLAISIISLAILENEEAGA